ncbi:MAG: helicase, partial [Patescibacteria group bacterium]|nr:helicase [Patescibacteria group bacterium]
MTEYEQFLERKSQSDLYSGFDSLWMPAYLFDFQKSLLDWAIRKGKAALFEDCGLGKSVQELVWAENVVRKTNGKVLLLAPIGVSWQMIDEGAKFDIDCKRSINGKPAANITTTNYERLHLFNPEDFTGVVCDESSILKSFTGQRKKDITRFMSKIPYRLLGTATAAPNDFNELGTSSEALGQLGYMDVLSTFFKNDENDIAQYKYSGKYIQGKWRLKGHAEHDFWKWVCSWARACRRPSDLGFNDEKFTLPKLMVQETPIENEEPLPGELFVTKAHTLQEQRAELRATLKHRCEKVAELVEPHPVSIVWCELNDEGDLLEQIIPNSVQIAGKHSDEIKEERLRAFVGGE